MNKVENTPLGKEERKELIRVALRFRRDKQGKEQGPDKNKNKDWREQHHNASGTKVRMEWNERRETRSWESTLTTNARTELLENQQWKE